MWKGICSTTIHTKRCTAEDEDRGRMVKCPRVLQRTWGGIERKGSDVRRTGFTRFFLKKPQKVFVGVINSRVTQ